VRSRKWFLRSSISSSRRREKGGSGQKVQVSSSRRRGDHSKMADEEKKLKLSPFQTFHLREMVKELLQTLSNHLLEIIWPSDQLKQLEVMAANKPLSAPIPPITTTPTPVETRVWAGEGQSSPYSCSSRLQPYWWWLTPSFGWCSCGDACEDLVRLWTDIQDWESLRQTRPR